MAQVFGEAGRNAIEESVKQTKKLIFAAMLGMLLLGALVGFMLGGIFPIKGLPISAALTVSVATMVLALLIERWTSSKIDEADRERAMWRKGAGGETSIATTLDSLPDEYVVVHDVTKRFGNIDHVVVGPTGIFVVDTKNWNGTVKSDGNGELLLNGKSPDKPAIKGMLHAVMDFQGKIKALAEKDYFVRGLMVFPIAYVEANFGTTRHIHCLRADRLVPYIQDQTFSKGLSTEEVDRIKRAVLQMAGMDERFVRGERQVSLDS